ncbi:MAG: hypothetical protein WBR26_05730 [Candidatus Acidiferrum sp.]
MKPSRLLTLSLSAALAFLALTSSAQAPQKPNWPTQAELQQRIDQLQKELDQAKLDAKSAALDTSYIQNNPSLAPSKISNRRCGKARYVPTHYPMPRTLARTPFPPTFSEARGSVDSRMCITPRQDTPNQ